MLQLKAPAVYRTFRLHGHTIVMEWGIGWSSIKVYIDCNDIPFETFTRYINTPEDAVKEMESIFNYLKTAYPNAKLLEEEIM